MKQLGNFSADTASFPGGTSPGIYFNDFNQDILLTHTQKLRILEISRGFRVL